MGSLNPPPELSLDFKPTFIPKTISQFLGQVSAIATVSEKILKLDDFVSRLETEMRKIDAFKRELPLCMLLINDAIITLKEESTVIKKSSNAEPVLEEFIPLKNTCDEDPKLETATKEKSGGDKKNWLSTTQLWNNPNANQTQTKKVIKDDGMIDDPYPARAFIPYKGICGFTMVEGDREESPIPGLSLITPGIKNPVRVNLITPGIKNPANSPQQQTSRKQRRCWSTELHRRFVNALQQLGGSQAATPKQIRELMQVDGLTNDEVKSHLQKYRLHTRRLPSSNTSSANQSGVVLGGGLWMPSQDSYIESSKNGISNSGSPDGPLLIGTTTTTGDNSDGEDDKSENYSWKSHHDV